MRACRNTLRSLRLPPDIGSAISASAAKSCFFFRELIAMPISTLAKRLLLFGASRGLGLAIAAEYLKLGWHVVATARNRSGTALHDLVGKAYGRLETEVVDITDPAQVTALHGRLGSERFDLLFVNAGVKNDDRETIADDPYQITDDHREQPLGPVFGQHAVSGQQPRAQAIEAQSNADQKVKEIVEDAGGLELDRAPVYPIVDSKDQRHRRESKKRNRADPPKQARGLLLSTSGECGDLSICTERGPLTMGRLTC
jgi:hypothetical protein